MKRFGLLLLIASLALSSSPTWAEVWPQFAVCHGRNKVLGFFGNRPVQVFCVQPLKGFNKYENSIAKNWLEGNARHFILEIVDVRECPQPVIGEMTGFVVLYRPVCDFWVGEVTSIPTYPSGSGKLQGIGGITVTSFSIMGDGEDKTAEVIGHGVTLPTEGPFAPRK